jgi:hypothetical protein
MSAEPDVAEHHGRGDADGAAPELLAMAADQQTTAMILDVGGTRLVIFVIHPPNMSAQDQTDLDTILSSTNIG